MALYRPADLIIQDWMLPDIQGSEVLDRLKCERKTKNTPVLMLTGCNKIGNIEGAFYRGADAYLTKTASLQILGKKVDKMLSSSRSH